MQSRLPTAVTFAVALAVAVGIYASTIDDSSASSMPLCRAAQLSHTVDGPIGPEAGPTIWVIFTNSSQETCTLPAGAPKAWVTWRERLLPTREQHRLGIRPASWAPFRPIHVLRPGAKAGVTFEWRNWCGKPQSNRDLMRIHLRFRRSAGVSFALGPRPACVSKGSPSTVLVSSPLVAS